MISKLLRFLFNSFFSVKIYFSNKLYSVVLKKMGNNVKILKNTLISFPQNVEIEDGVFVNRGCFFQGNGGLIIKKNTIFGPGVNIYTSNHIFSDIKKTIREQGDIYKSVLIDEDCWIGGNSIILPGVHIGKGSVIGAGSVVTKNIAEYSIAVGNPTRIIKNRQNYS